jgi:glycopeptide antibiotics resistance protein
MPRDYTVVNQFFLEPVWREFSSSPTYWGDIFKNVIGFMPLGFCFYPFLLSFGVKRAALLAVAAGAGVSLAMELTQAMMPARDSSTTDVLANTVGTWIGVAWYAVVRRITPVWFSRWQPLAVAPASDLYTGTPQRP